jgi:hypothetical protein
MRTATRLHFAAIPALVLLACSGGGGGAQSGGGQDGKTALVYEALQYTVGQPDGTHIILRSRGSGHGTAQPYFDVFVEDGLGNTEVFVGDPVWYHLGSTSAAAAVGRTLDEGSVCGHFASPDEDYYLDINGGSDMGGVTYQLRTRSFASSPGVAGVAAAADPTPIHIDTETGGDVDTGMRAQWGGAYENRNGALFWSGSRWVTNDTAAHAYFTDLRTGERLKPHDVTTIGTTASSQDVQPGFSLTRSWFTYSAARAPGGGLEGLGASYPVEFDVEFTDSTGIIREMRFTPALASETEE